MRVFLFFIIFIAIGCESKSCRDQKYSHRMKPTCSEEIENTWMALDASLKEGKTDIEMDLRITSDGVLIVFHDDNLERMTGDKRQVRDVSYADLPMVHGKSLIPSYERIVKTLNFREYKGHLRLDVKEITSEEIGTLNKLSSQYLLGTYEIIYGKRDDILKSLCATFGSVRSYGKTENLCLSM